jgi:transcriptional regulator with XRE-family HTH domain
MTTEISLGERIKTCRKRRGMTQAVLAELIGRSERWLVDVEHDTVDLRLSDVRELARALNVDVAQLTGAQISIPTSARPRAAASTNGATASAGSGNLLVDQEHTELVYRDQVYRARMRRLLVNTGSVPITRFLVRI